MPFVLDPNGTTALPIPGDESCVMGTITQHVWVQTSLPLIAGLMEQIMGGLGSIQVHTLLCRGMLTVLNLPVIDNGTLMAQGKAILGFQFHPLVNSPYPQRRLRH